MFKLAMRLLRNKCGFCTESLKTKKFEIQANLVDLDTVRMDMESFRKSKVVQAQARAAKKLYEGFD